MNQKATLSGVNVQLCRLVILRASSHGRNKNGW